MKPLFKPGDVVQVICPEYSSIFGRTYTVMGVQPEYRAARPGEFYLYELSSSQGGTTLYERRLALHRPVKVTTTRKRYGENIEINKNSSPRPLDEGSGGN